MKNNNLLFRLVVLVAAVMCALGAAAAEAYACYTSSNTTLTFYYDNLRSSRPGTTYDLNTGSNDVGWDTDGTKSYVTKVVFDPSFANARPTTTYDWFYHMGNLESITGMSYLNTSEVTNMAYMFTTCENLTSLDLSSFNTSQVTNMEFMFNTCSNLRTIYVGDGWSTVAVTRSGIMFANCTSLVGGQGTTWNDSNPRDKTYAHIDGGPSNPGYFTDKNPTVAYACYTSSNTTLTFYYDKLRSSRPGTTYDLNTGTNSVAWYTDGTYANVTKVVFDPSFAGARPTSTFSWFLNMTNLQSITGMEYLNTSEVINTSYMFYRCQGLTSLDLSSFNTSNVTMMNYMFAECSKLQTINASENWTTTAVTQSAFMFTNCTRLVGGQGTVYDANHVDKTYAHIDGGPSNPGYFTDKNAPEAYACYTPSNTTLTFYYDKYRSYRTGTTYDLNTGSTYPAWYIDGTCANVTKVVFHFLFADARPTTTGSWFQNMDKLQDVVDMNYLNTSQVTYMAYMFYNCSSLTSIDLSSFNTSQVTMMRTMFGNCQALESLDLGRFNTSQVTNMGYMFNNCSNLQTIYVDSGWSTAAVTYSSNMFNGCTRLMGEQGTTYSNSNPKDATYAHIDGGWSNPGYFTQWKEAYACYTPSNTTLTFYYDNQRSSRPGTTYDVNSDPYGPRWYIDGIHTNVTQVVFEPSFADARPTTVLGWFYGMTELQSIEGMSYLNTSEVTDMSYLFTMCYRLASVDLTHFNTAKVTKMNHMFTYNHMLTSLDLSSFNTANVTNMESMFHGSRRLQTIYVGAGWSTAAVTSSTDMFYDCISLVGGQGTTYDDNHVGIAYAHIDGGPSNPGYFTAEGEQPWIPTEAYACYTPENTTLTFYYDKLRSTRTGTTYDLNTGASVTGWGADGTNVDVTKVVFDPSFADARPTTTYDWFYNMQELESITGMSYLNTSEVTDMGYMFMNCLVLTSLDVSHFNTSEVTNMYGMFANCENLTSLDLSSFNTSKVTDIGLMFYYCSNLRTICVDNGWSTAAVTSSTYMFDGNSSLVGGQGTTYSNSNPKDKTYAHIDGGPSNPGYFTDINPVEAYACYTPENTTLTFYYDKQRSSRPGMTYDLNTGTNYTGWDNDDTNLSVTHAVFDPSFANARPTTTFAWFYGMTKLQDITDIHYLNTDSVTYMGGMFWRCLVLENVDLSNFNTDNVTSMSQMFFYCSSMTSLDLSSFNTSKVTSMTRLFYACENLQTIYVGDGWSTDAVTSSTEMFNGCTSLVGGQGTTYSSSNPKDKTYAHIDGGPSNPGYFTGNSVTVRGDVNGVGGVDMDDLTALINYLLSGDATGINLANAASCDSLDSTTVDMDDLTALINYLLASTWP